MKKKKRFVVLIFLIILISLIAGCLVYNFYFKKAPTKPTGPLIRGTSTSFNRCVNVTDNYALPNFERLKGVMAEQQIVKDVPPKGKILVRFYHFIEGCRKWDKTYFLSDGKIEEKNVESDIEIWISSNYADKVNENNFCNIVSEARKNGDLGYIVNIGTTKLMWTYGGLLKYKGCIEEGKLSSISPLFIIKKSLDAVLDDIKSFF